MMNRTERKRVRSNFTTRVDIQCNNGIILNAKSKNISLNGIFILSEKSPPIDSVCTLTLILDNGITRPISVTLSGKVVRHEPNGFAVTFLEMDASDFSHLKNIVKYNSENPNEFCQQCEKRAGFK